MTPDEHLSIAGLMAALIKSMDRLDSQLQLDFQNNLKQASDLIKISNPEAVGVHMTLTACANLVARMK